MLSIATLREEIVNLYGRTKLVLHEPKKKRRLARRSPKTHYPQYEFGKWTYGIPKIYSWGEGTTLKVGAFRSIADDVRIFLGGEHRVDWVTTYPFCVFWEAAKHIPGHPSSKGDVIIGNDVWIGHGATILSGIRVGDGAVIGAYSVVTKDVRPYHIVSGNPARRIRQRFDDATVGRLLGIAWWQWEDSRIQKAIPYLSTQDTTTFLNLFESGEL
jgi:acetyltransferase-like isoleucine patch superfamily enzyme